MDEQPVETTLYSLRSAAPEPQERRGDNRYMSLLRVGALMIGGRRELCLIRNISAGGMLIRAYCAIQEGNRLSIELKQGEPIHGAAKWVRDDAVGVSFDKPVDVLSLLAVSNEGPRPRMPRVEVQCTAWLREGARMHRIRGVNISQGGVRVETAADLPIGADVIVTLNGLAPCPGTVRWRDSRSYGITFNRVLPLPLLVSWLQQHREQLRATG